MHRTRRQAAERRLQGQVVGSVLVLCHGNVCRSPYAAARLAQFVAARGRVLQVDSAGFIGPDRQSPPELIELAQRRGLDLAGHRSKVLTSALTAAADLIVVMNVLQAHEIRRLLGVSAARILVLGDLDPDPIDTREIQDPWGQPLEVYERVMTRLDRCVRRLGDLISPA